MGATSRGNVALGALNGLWGDRLAAAGSELAVCMTLRHAGADVPIERTRRLRRIVSRRRPIVWLSTCSICETERSPGHRRDRKQRQHDAFRFGDPRRGPRVHAAVRPLQHRAPHHRQRSRPLRPSRGSSWLCGRPRSQRSHSSATRWVASSPAAPVTTLTGAAPRWVEQARHVFGLGTPHLGASVGAWASTALPGHSARFPETRGARLVCSTPAASGIKDLRFGSLLEEDWTDQDIDGFLTGRAAEVPLMPHVSYYFVGATVTQDRHHPLGWLAGDLLVQFSWRRDRGAADACRSTSTTAATSVDSTTSTCSATLTSTPSSNNGSARPPSSSPSVG